jgi:hypothetical protein
VVSSVAAFKRMPISESSGAITISGAALVGVVACWAVSGWDAAMLVAALGAFGQVAIALGAFLVTRSQLHHAKAQWADERAEKDRELEHSKIESLAKDAQLKAFNDLQEKGRLTEKIKLFNNLCKVVERNIVRNTATPFSITEQLIALYADLSSRRRFQSILESKNAEMLWEMAEHSSMGKLDQKSLAYKFKRNEVFAMMCESNEST